MTRDGILRKTALAGRRVGLPGEHGRARHPQPGQSESGHHRLATGRRGLGDRHVVDANGDPVVGDLVNALGPREVPERGILAEQTDRRDLTDQNGAFRVRQASPYGYLVQICNPEPSDRTACKETAQGVDHVITYVGPAGVTDSWVLQTSLFPSPAHDRDLGAVTVKPQGFVHGTIQRAAYQSIRLLRLNGTVAYYNSTDEQGSYRFQGLAPGRYRVAAGGDGWRPWQSDIVTVPADGDVEVNGVLDRGATIHGVVRSGGQRVPFLDILVRRSGRPYLRGHHHQRERLLPGLRAAARGSSEWASATTAASTSGGRSRSASTTRTLRSAAKISLVKGAVITVALRAGGQPAIRAADELRDGTGHAILGQRNFDGQVTYHGLSPGDYTVVAGNDTRFTVARVRVTTVKTYDLGTRVLNRPTLTLTGTTAPGAVVEAFSGSSCPPGEGARPGSFHEIEVADDAGRYAIHGLVPGRYMLGSDGWPSNYAPYCRNDVPINHDRRAALPLQVGSIASGRLVYASTGTPVITTLSYELSYPPGSQTNPTDEHPTRDKTAWASGLFRIDRLAPGQVTGRLAISAEPTRSRRPSSW